MPQNGTEIALCSVSIVREREEALNLHKCFNVPCLLLPHIEIKGRSDQKAVYFGHNRVFSICNCSHTIYLGLNISICLYELCYWIFFWTPVC